MATSFLSRKPGLRPRQHPVQPGRPGRNIDWVLMIRAGGAHDRSGCLVVYSASRTRIAADPYAFVTRQVVFAIIAVRRDGRSS